MSSNTSEPGGRRARRGQVRVGRVPTWPGMISAQDPPPPRDRHRAVRARRRARRGARRAWLVGGAGLAASLAAAALVLVYTDAASAPLQSATVADPVLGGGPGCEPTRGAQLVRGNGTGSTASGPDVILAFQHAYYVTRSGAVARSLTVPDAAVPPVAVIDAGIASVPTGTQHCVMITPMLDGRYDVVITELRPDSANRTYRQFVTVATTDDEAAIVKIAPPN
ncbi:hypothetical protein IFM12275_46990 [Nocardia sputorum]|uniref:hypothetical protein n=1 Tax=Nocardia TaxID=1817 RepID=UPI0024912A5D|nr:hypothetical protein [Nocardia sputorum]BDT94723.1 hypothetical protein IFM12275_46990 [Nocardia sputorum]